MAAIPERVGRHPDFIPRSLDFPVSESGPAFFRWQVNATLRELYARLGCSRLTHRPVYTTFRIGEDLHCSITLVTHEEWAAIERSRWDFIRERCYGDHGGE